MWIWSRGQCSTSINGGDITLIRGYEPLDIIELPVPGELTAGIVFPQVDVPTRDARQLIRQQVPLKDAAQQWGNIAGLVAGLYREDYALMGRSMHDILIEPTRAILIPEFYEMKRIAIQAGALSFGISGSGPSVVAMSRGEMLRNWRLIAFRHICPRVVSRV